MNRELFYKGARNLATGGDLYPLGHCGGEFPHFYRVKFAPKRSTRGGSDFKLHHLVSIFDSKPGPLPSPPPSVPVCLGNRLCAVTQFCG